jgi:hypothetical protein
MVQLSHKNNPFQEKKINLFTDINDHLISWKFTYDSLSKNKRSCHAYAEKELPGKFHVYPEQAAAYCVTIRISGKISKGA